MNNMAAFFARLIEPHNALLLYAWVMTLIALVGGFGNAWGTPPGTAQPTSRRYGSIALFILLVIVLVVCFLAWGFRVFTG